MSMELRPILVILNIPPFLFLLKVNKNISEYYEDIDSEDDFDVESDNFEVEKGNISAAEDVENKENQEESREDAELAVKTLMITMVMEESGLEQETKLITERQVKVTVPTQKYQSTHWKVSMMRPMLRC